MHGLVQYLFKEIRFAQHGSLLANGFGQKFIARG
jgi:hypothetical protein